MPTSNLKVPGYRLHKASGRAIVKLGGKVHYLGKYGSQQSKLEYARLIAQRSAVSANEPPASCGDLTIVEMLASFRRFALQHYRKDGSPTGEVTNFDQSMKPLVALYATERVCDFGPLKLKAVRNLMITGYTDRRGCVVRGLSRGVVNGRIARIRRIFKWAVSEELAPPSLAHALSTVTGLQRGRTECRETEPVRPVADEHVAATLGFLPEVVADMVRVQRLTGCRPGDVCNMRPIDIDRSASPWQYRPPNHKTAHFGRDRVVFIGPRAQAVLLPYLLRDRESYCFSPADSERKRKDRLRANRKTPVQPSQIDRSKRRPKVKPSARYVKDAYARAVRRGCELADAKAHADDPTAPADQRIIPRWTPNQLRHTAATEIRKRFGLEAAQICLGHAAANVTQVYAERDLQAGMAVMAQIG